MRDIDMGEAFGVFAAFLCLVAVVAGMAWMVHYDATNKAGCAHTLAGVKCAQIDTGAQR